MTCRDFLARYSEYLDERMDAADAARWDGHAAACQSCARYDRVVRSGLERLRQSPEIQPSPDFRRRLQRRLHTLDEGPDPGPRASGGPAGTVAIAAVLAMVAWSPLMRSHAHAPDTGASNPERVRVERDPTVAGPAVRQPVEPALRRSWTDHTAVPLLFGSPAAGAFHADGPAVRSTGYEVSPGPHSPLIVGRPAFRAADGTAYEHAAVRFPASR